MDTKRLLYWGDLEESRQRRARRGLTALSPWVLSVLAGLVLAAEVARGMHLFGASVAAGATWLTASSEWLAALIASHMAVFIGAPFRMYWRRDSAMLARSPIPGDVLFQVALIRNLRAAGQVALPLAMAALVFALGPHGSEMLALKHLALVLVAALGAGLLGPAVSLAAGAIVASNKAQALIGSLGGEFQAPPTTLLGALPGIVGAGVVLELVALASWARGADSTAVGDPGLIVAVGVVVPLTAGGWALARAGAVMLAAVREVAALDQERLAHVDLAGPSPLERLAGRWLKNPGGRLVLDKDASLSRRRYPIPFFVGVVGLIASWILAAVAPEDLLWAGMIHAGVGVYGVIMARRAAIPPIEYPTFLASLPIAPDAALRAKQARLFLWVLVYQGLGALLIIARAPQPATTAILLGVIAMATVIGGLAALRAG